MFQRKNARIFLSSLLIFCGIGLMGNCSAQSQSSQNQSVFFANLQQLNISVPYLISQKSLSRYELTRLLNAVECQDCTVPQPATRLKYDEPFWNNFLTLPGKDFRDIGYLSGNWQGTNYYYCVAKVGDDDSMRGYPLATSPICWGKFCGQRSVSRAEFFQTLSNLLLDKVKNNYKVARWTIKKRLKQQKTDSYEYRVFNSAELEVLEKKENQTASPTTRTEFTTYLKYCMFNPAECGFQTFEGLRAGVWPLSEVNLLIQANIITAQDIHSLAKPITPQEALNQLQLLHQLHTKCEFNLDYDCDGIPNDEDNCPYTYNPSQNDLDGYGIGDVCDDDIDGDGLKNPVGLVDDNWNINYGLLKTHPLEDSTPLGELQENSSYFIHISSLNQSSPAFVQFEIRGSEAPQKVERSFGDLSTGSGTKVQHLYSEQGRFTVLAKLSTKKNQTFLLKTEIKIGESSDTAYSLNIKPISIDSRTQTASFQPDFQWKFDAFERQNSAIGKAERVSSAKAFTTSLIAGKRNNITLKGYSEGKLVAVASTDLLETNGTFFAVTPNYAPLLKTLDTKLTTTLQLHNLSLSNIRNIKRDFGDGTNFTDTKLLNSHTYTTPGQKILIQKIVLKNNQELISTSSLSITDPQKIGNQAFNLLPKTINWTYQLSLQALWTIKGELTIKSLLNGQQDAITTVTLSSLQQPFLTINKKQGLVKVNNKIQIQGGETLENEGILVLWGKSTEINFEINQLFSGLKCDLDQDGIPDLYDDDLDGDGVKNLLGMIKYERADCQLIPGDNVDTEVYKQHFGICSLDNCPLIANATQSDLNLNGIGDSCEEATSCGNGKIDLWETCKTCPQDVGPCTAFCGNGIIEPAETCTNCPQDVPVCKESSCWNGKIETQAWEQCDNGTNNGEDWKCSLSCTLLNPQQPLCGNGKIDQGETCNTCPQDLKDICIDPWKKECGNGKIDQGEDCKSCPKDVGPCTAFCGNGKIEPAETCTNCPQDVPVCKETSCWNGKIDAWEDCKSCPKDVGSCTAFCGNGTIEPAETCTNCPEDVKVCKETSCWNGKVETQAWEQCDNGSNNGKDGKCSHSCSLINPQKPLCWNRKIDQWEDCKNCPQDLKDICIDDGEKSFCWNGKIDQWEDCKNCPQDLKDICIDDWEKSLCWNGIADLGEDCFTCPADIPVCDQDGDGCPDVSDPCPTIPGTNWSCCPEIPALCEGEDCPLVKPICNQCPCHFADYSNTLQKDDEVRARLRDQKLNVHYNYSPFTALRNRLSFE